MRAWFGRSAFFSCVLLFTQGSAAQFAYQKDVVMQFGVSDLERSIEFYTETLGLELFERNDAIGWARVRTAVPGVTIGLGVRSDADRLGSGTSSINLAVGNLDEVVAILQSRGVQFEGPILEIPGVVRLADFLDPDGNRIRLAGAP